jgi:hypothetical protein
MSPSRPWHFLPWHFVLPGANLLPIGREGKTFFGHARVGITQIYLG